jgi:3-isopropylmalate dehydratase small subunit
LTAQAAAGACLTVDLVAQRVLAGGADYPFDIEPWRREALLNGWDEIETIRNRYGADITAFERAQARSMPWLWAQKETI